MHQQQLAAAIPQAATPPPASAPAMVDLGYHRPTVATRVAIRPGSRTARTTPRRRSFAGRRPPMALRWPGQGRAARRITTPPARLRLSWRLDRNRAAGGALAAPNAGGNALTPNMNDAALKAQIMGGWPFGGGGGQPHAPAVAPRARAQAPAPGFQPKKFFSNPVNWQYPFRCDRQAACQERRYFSGPIPPHQRTSKRPSWLRYGPPVAVSRANRRLGPPITCALDGEQTRQPGGSARAVAGDIGWTVSVSATVASSSPMRFSSSTTCLAALGATATAGARSARTLSTDIRNSRSWTATGSPGGQAGYWLRLVRAGKGVGRGI
jgi:hypothetical protein